MSDLESQAALRALRHGGLSGIPDHEFDALHAAVVGEHSLRNGWNGNCREVSSRPPDRVCACGLRFNDIEILRVHAYPELRHGRDPTFRPKAGDVLVTKDGDRWTITSREGSSVRFTENGHRAVAGLGHVRLMCGIEYGGSVANYTEDSCAEEFVSTNNDAPKETRASREGT